MISITAQQDESALIRRANQLYHELTQESFEHIHRHRFRIQKPFWDTVARVALDTGRRGPIADSTRATRGRTVLDLACGTGFVTRTLAAHLTSCDNLVAADLNRGQLRTAGANWKAFRLHHADAPGFIRLASDAQTLPLPDGSVDLVAINASLHHMPSPTQVLGEIDRILRPGGFFALGFEPNRAYFKCRVLAGLDTAFSRLHWYASPRQNWRRLRTRLALASVQTAHDLADQTAVLNEMNRTLLGEGLISRPMPGGRLLDLVDPHSRGEDNAVGFDPGDLITQVMPTYRTCLLITTDYLGETARFWPTARTLTDTVLRAFIPGHGSLFSWLLQKPEAAR
jgi:ubiquinone/menaquinone biosynthesis C-methylase UbiE